MASLRLDIPKSDQEILKTWLGLPHDRALSILTSLRAATPALSPRRLAERVARDLGEDGAIARKLIPVLATMCITARVPTRDVSDFTDAVIAIVFSDETPDPQHRSLVHQALEIESLQTTAKAISIQTDFERTYCSATSVSEIRPVFRDHDLQASALLIVHQLRIDFHSRTHIGVKDRQATVIGMDKEDLIALRGVIDRALAKHDSLSGLGAALHLPILEPEQS